MGARKSPHNDVLGTFTNLLCCLVDPLCCFVDLVCRLAYHLGVLVNTLL